MSRRRGPTELQVGNDSFLDIVANIVGILIILIVVAGVRVSRAPVSTVAEEPGSPATQTEPVDDPPAVDRSDDVSRLSGDVARLDQEVSTESERLRVLGRSMDESQRRQRERETHLKREASSLEVLAASLTSTEATAKQLIRQRTRAREQLGVLEQAADTTRTLEHKLTPLSKMVRGEEQHFHLLAGRVAAIPLGPLKRRVRDQLQRHSRHVAQSRRHEGTVGPVDGFVMDFTIERRRVSVVDELRYGRAMIRVGVSHWSIHPEADLASETVTEALRRGSRFQAALKSCPPETALTFWVYPDSFVAFRRLQQVVQQAGFRVAGRPLPQGVLVSGSPDGTRSQSQ